MSDTQLESRIRRKLLQAVDMSRKLLQAVDMIQLNVISGSGNPGPAALRLDSVRLRPSHGRVGVRAAGPGVSRAGESFSLSQLASSVPGKTRTLLSRLPLLRLRLSLSSPSHRIIMIAGQCALRAAAQLDYKPDHFILCTILLSSTVI
jgi:hypothetical protein